MIIFSTHPELRKLGKGQFQKMRHDYVNLHVIGMHQYNNKHNELL